MMDGCWICQPMAFVSSLPYLVVGIILFLQNKNRDRLFYAWSLMLGLVSLSSMFFHSTFTRASMAMDYTSIIFLMTFFFVTKLMKASPRKINLKLGLPIYYVALYLFLLPLDIWSQFYVCLAMFTIASMDFLYQRGLSVLLERSLIISFGLLAISLGFMLIDRHETFCALKYVPYGHTIWHLGSALSAYYFGYWYFIEKKHSVA